MYIAFFDSGIGGFTVLRDALKTLPNENYIYYGDTLNAPYGTKSKNIIKEHIFEAIESILRYQIKALVIACNTATSVTINDLRNRYDFPVIGMEPAIKPALDNNKRFGKKVLVLATPLTLKEEKFENLVTQLKQEDLIEALPLPEMVEFAEKLNFDEKFIENYFRYKFKELNLSDYSAIVLGCTHFIFYKEIFQKIMPAHISIIDGNSGTVNHLNNVLKQNDMLNDGSKGEIIIHLSGNGEETKISSMMKYLKEGLPDNFKYNFNILS